jgi:hypothetical protein
LGKQTAREAQMKPGSAISLMMASLMRRCAANGFS